VYKLPRPECNKEYVGQTGSSFTKRFKEHLLLFINNYFISKFEQNLLENGKCKFVILVKRRFFLRTEAEFASET